MAKAADLRADGLHPPKVSIVVPCRNEAETIAGFLQDLIGQESPPGGSGLEILIADGRSDDGTRAILEQLASSDSRIVLIDNPARIVSTGLNAAVHAARSDIIVRMDVHTEYAPDYVRQCVAVLEETGADNVGGAWRARGEGRMQRAVAAAFRSRFGSGGGRAHDPDYEGELDTVYLGCWTRSTLLRVGLFDEGLVRNQDDELNLRLRRAGGRIWQSPRIRSWYRPRSSLSALFRQYLQYGYWKMRVIQKHGRPASARHLVPVAFVLGAATGWIGGLIHPALWLAYAGALGLYAVLSLIFSARAAAAAGWDLLPLLPAVFLTYHVSYGTGFALGFVDFYALRRGGRTAMTSLSRPIPGRSAARSARGGPD
jgi:glycosyltransferase involved in cell wall biosynthesis